jgi:VDE lipocalin domain
MVICRGNLSQVLTRKKRSKKIAEFWENWYFIGENDKDADEEFKFVYYNGKTRQNTYDGAFVYARTQHLSPASMEKVYRIAESAGLNPNQFCQVQNVGIDDVVIDNDQPFLDNPAPPQQQTDFWRGLLASTRVSELLGVEPVAARDTVDSVSASRPQQNQPTQQQQQQQRAWWYEAGDYLENPHRHFQAMEQLRVLVEWPQQG